MQNTLEVLTGLVVGYKRDGRCQYDPQVKQELVRRCIPPGVSVATSAVASARGNANLGVWVFVRAGVLEAVAPNLSL